MATIDYQLENYIEAGGDLLSLHGCQVKFYKDTFRGKKECVGRFEGLDGNGKAIVRHNGVQENSWYLPYYLAPGKVSIILNDGQPVPYYSRPLTQA